MLQASRFLIEELGLLITPARGFEIGVHGASRGAQCIRIRLAPRASRVGPDRPIGRHAAQPVAPPGRGHKPSAPIRQKPAPKRTWPTEVVCRYGCWGCCASSWGLVNRCFPGTLRASSHIPDGSTWRNMIGWRTRPRRRPQRCFRHYVRSAEPLAEGAGCG